jgi:hypothetical protein
MTMSIREIQPHWTAVSPYLAIHSEEDYKRAIEQLNQLAVCRRSQTRQTKTKLM